MSDRLQELTVFVRAAESGSFSRAARELGLSQPSVSRIVADLEARLGVKLLLRTTRRIVPTDAGAAFLAAARRVVDELEAAEDIARGVDSLRGLLRIALPATAGARQVIPHLPLFLERHPQLRLELIESDARQDLILEGVDMAIRFSLGTLPDSGFGARRLTRVARMAVAAPSYLARRGVPKTAEALAEHDGIFGPGVMARNAWRFSRDGATVAATIDGRVTAASAEGVAACARAGLGIAIASAWMAGADLAAGALIRLLPDYTLESVDVWAVFPGGRHPSQKVRAFVDYLAGVFAEDA